MPSPFMVDYLFQASSAVAFASFLILLAQALCRIYSKQKSQAQTDSLVALSGVTSGEEAQKPETTFAGSGDWASAVADTGLDDGLQDKVGALISQIRCTDTTPEIANIICAYLFAAQDLLGLRRTRAGGGGWMTNAELNAAADALVRETTDAVKSLQAKADPKKRRWGPDAEAVAKVGLVSLVAARLAWAFAQAAEEQSLPRGQHVDLTRFTLRGEPRTYSAEAGAVLAPAILAIWRAFVHICKHFSELASLVFAPILYPAEAAFRCLASTLLLLGLPLSIPAVYAISFFSILGMATLAGLYSEDEREDKLDVAGGKKQDKMA